MLALLLATAPAIPNDVGGKYVAGAYVVFIVLLLIYVAIMAMKLARIERGLGEVAEIAAASPIVSVSVSSRSAATERPSVSERRSRSSSGAVLCETPRARSSLTAGSPGRSRRRRRPG